MQRRVQQNDTGLVDGAGATDFGPKQHRGCRRRGRTRCSGAAHRHMRTATCLGGRVHPLSTAAGRLLVVLLPHQQQVVVLLLVVLLLVVLPLVLLPLLVLQLVVVVVVVVVLLVSFAEGR